MTQATQNPRRDARFYQHKSHFLEYVDPAVGRGLEIGAFDLPLVEPSEGQCDIADWNTIEDLKDIARQLPGHNPEFVVPVRFNLLEGYDQVPDGYDWITASHVIEHVPDVIGWLAQVSSKLKPGGVLFLVIPDKRYIFDIYRRESTLTDALAARRFGLKHPSFAQVFDHYYYSAPGVAAHDVWAGNPAPGPALNFAGSLAQAEKAEHSYQDAHCWVLTPDSFSALFRSVVDAQMTNLQLKDLRPTVSGGIDFSVVLCKSVQSELEDKENPNVVSSPSPQRVIKEEKTPIDECAAVLLTGLRKNIIQGQLSDRKGVAALKFDVFRDGKQIEYDIVDNLDKAAGTFQIVLPLSMRAADGPSINVKFAKTERPVPTGPDLQGFVNNINESRFGHLLENPLFYRSFVHSRPRMEIPQHFVDHVAGGGDQESYRLLAIATIIDILNFGVIDAPSNKVIDLGCGCGRMGAMISSILDPAEGGAYFGFDIWTEGVTWAQENLTKYYPHASFKILAGHHGYDAHASYRIDLPDSSQDAAIATSVFTHLRAKPANDYAAEIARILRPGGKAYTTFFASKDVCRSFNMPQPAEEDEYAINVVKVQAEETFTDEDRVVEMFERHGLKVLGIKYGNWRGGQFPSRGIGGGQDVFILRRL